MDIDAEIHKVEEVRLLLTTTSGLTTAQDISLSKIVALVEEGENQRRTYCQATRSRRKGARTLLSAIYQRLGIDILFLCSIAFSITKLSEVKKHEKPFISKLESWRRNVQITQSICNLAQQYIAPYRELLSQLVTGESTGPTKRGPCFDSSPAKRVLTSSNGHGIFPSYHGVWDIQATGERANETCVDDDHDSDSSDDSELAGQRAQAAHRDDAHSTNVEDVPLYANVYKLKAMDVIRVLVNQKDNENRLTMPHLPDSMPFITIRCSRTLAMQFLTKREQVKW